MSQDMIISTDELREAERAACLKALDDVLLLSANNPPICVLVKSWVDRLKSAYKEGGVTELEVIQEKDCESAEIMTKEYGVNFIRKKVEK